MQTRFVAQKTMSGNATNDASPKVCLHNHFDKDLFVSEMKLHVASSIGTHFRTGPPAGEVSAAAFTSWSLFSCTGVHFMAAWCVCFYLSLFEKEFHIFSGTVLLLRFLLFVSGLRHHNNISIFSVHAVAVSPDQLLATRFTFDRDCTTREIDYSHMWR